MQNVASIDHEVTRRITGSYWSTARCTPNCKGWAGGRRESTMYCILNPVRVVSLIRIEALWMREEHRQKSCEREREREREGYGEQRSNIERDERRRFGRGSGGTRNGRAALIRPDHSHRTNVFYCPRLSAIEARSHPPSLRARYVVTVIVTISLALGNTLAYTPLRNVRNENECISDSDKYVADPMLLLLPSLARAGTASLRRRRYEMNRWS